MNKLITILILSFVVLMSCNKSPEFITVKGGTSVVIEEEFSQTPMSFSKIIDSITYIKLETNPKCIIGRVAKIIQYKDRCYLLDIKTKSILWFNNKGAFVNKIKNIGKGPGEYLKISDFFVSRNKIIIYDEILNKIFKYSLDGEYIDAISLGEDLIRHIMPLDEGGYLCVNEHDRGENTKVGLWKIDSTGKFQKNILRLNKNNGDLSSWNPLYKYEDEIRYMSNLNNSLYSYKNNSLTKLYSYKVKDVFSAEDVKTGEIPNKDLQIESYSISETKNWLISEWADYNFGKGSRIIYHSKKDNSIVINKGYVNDFSGVSGFVRQQHYVNNKLLTIFSSKDIITYKEIILQFDKDFDFEGIQNVSNPLIQICHFKE